MSFSSFPHLVFLQATLLYHFVSLFLEGDDDESHEDVDEEEREDHKVNHVENRHLHSVPATRPQVLLCDIRGMLKDPESEKITS